LYNSSGDDVITKKWSWKFG